MSLTFYPMATNISKRLSIDELFLGIREGNRVALSRAITLSESKLVADKLQAEELLDRLIPSTGASLRIGISGIPGVGKSTFIEAFGEHLTSLGKKVAVLAVDPSSQQSKGSILGDKTRMNQLAINPNAYIRPSPTGNTLGGVAEKTREAMLLCEAAGFDVILVETVGVGQSETLVRGMVDFFLLLMIPGAGDELQGIKKGIMEMADAIVINKADGDNIAAATLAQQEYAQAIHLFTAPPSGWITRVTTCSALQNIGIDEAWQLIVKFREHMMANGYFDHQRSQQNLKWMQQKIDALLREEFTTLVEKEASTLEDKVKKKEINPAVAARQLFELYKKKKGQ